MEVALLLYGPILTPSAMALALTNPDQAVLAGLWVVSHTPVTSLGPRPSKLKASAKI